jgi:subtilisin family serine protease
MNHPRGRGLWPIVLLGAALVSVAPMAPIAWASDEAPFFWYDGAKQELEIDPFRLAVQWRNEAAAGKTDAFAEARKVEALTTAGLTVADWRPQVARWDLLELAEPLVHSNSLAGDAGAGARSTNQAVASALGRLLQSPDVEFVAPVYRGPGDHWFFFTSEILLRFEAEHRDRGREIARDLLARPGKSGFDVEMAETDWGHLPGAIRLECAARNATDVLDLANRLAADPRVAWAEPNARFSGRYHYEPNDPFFSELWGLRNTGQHSGTPDMDMDADLAWDITRGSPEVPVLILETGIQPDHPDLNYLDGVDFSGQHLGGGPFNVCDNHGTWVAGCVSAIIDNELGVVGAAPHSPILSARMGVADLECGLGFYAETGWVVNALAWGLINGARVSNSSWGGGFGGQAMADAFFSSRRGGMVHFSSAGNDGQNGVGFPASLPSVNAISALAPSGQLAPFSNFGPDVMFCAPGDIIATTDRTGSAGGRPGDYATVGGTSFASPYAAAVAALILSDDPTLTPGEVEARMREGARDLGAPGFDQVFAWGLVNAHQSLLLNPTRSQKPIPRTPPTAIHLRMVGPNPFVISTTIQIDLTETVHVSVAVFDVQGRRVRQLADEVFATGQHALEWDGRDEAGRRVASGVYYARFRTPGISQQQKILRLQ